MAFDPVSIVIIVLVLAFTLHGIYRIARSGKRRTILPSTRTNLTEHISEGAKARRSRGRGSRRDRSLISATTESLGEGSTIGAGVQETEVSSREISVLEKRLEREGAKRGAVQISLMWNNWNDLDLHVITPSGEHIYHDHRKSTCEGELDVDMNFKPTSKTPVENIVWTRTPPAGVYRIGIRHYKIHKRGLFAWAPVLSKIHMKNATDYTVSVSIGESKRFYEGTVEKSNELQFVAKFAIAEPGQSDVIEKPQETEEPPEAEEPQEAEEFSEAREVDALRRRVGTVHDGVSVTLNWDSSSDLGLSVITPDGSAVSFFDPEESKGGSFDIESFNPNEGRQVVSWSENPPAGDYSIIVQHFETEGEGEDSEFTVSIDNRGDEEEISGTISSDGSQVEAGTFVVS